MKDLKNLQLGYKNLQVGYNNFKECFNELINSNNENVATYLSLLSSVSVLEYRSKYYSDLYYNVQTLKEEITNKILNMKSVHVK